MTTSHFIASLLAAASLAVAAPVLAAEPAPEVVRASQAIEDGFEIDLSAEARARRADTREVVLEARIGERAYQARVADLAAVKAAAKADGKSK